MNTERTYSLEEVKQHNKPNDCWMIIKGKVYDVSNFDDHPGGTMIIQGNGGKDVSDDFESIGHSSDARSLLKTFYIGKLENPDGWINTLLKKLNY